MPRKRSKQQLANISHGSEANMVKEGAWGKAQGREHVLLREGWGCRKEWEPPGAMGDGDQYDLAVSVLGAAPAMGPSGTT